MEVMSRKEDEFKEMLQKKVDISHWAAHTANEEILKSAITELRGMGYDIKKDINLFKRLEFFQSIKCATTLNYRDPDSFERLLKTFDKMMSQYAEDFEGKGIHMYRWLYVRDKLMIQMGLLVLYKHMKYTFTELPSVPNALIVPSSWNAGNYTGELKSRLENNSPTYNFKTADRELYRSSFEGRVYLKLTNFIQRNKKVDIVNMYDVFFENRLSTFVRDYCAFVAEAEKNALKSPFMVISQYHPGYMAPYTDAVIKSEPGVSSVLQPLQQEMIIPAQTSQSEDIHQNNTPLSPLPIQTDAVSSASNQDKTAATASSVSKHKRSIVTASPRSSSRVNKKMNTETAETSIMGLRNAQNILMKSDEIDPLNDIAMDPDLTETRATVGTKRKVSTVTNDTHDAIGTSENIDINAPPPTATSSSRNPTKSLGGPRPGAQKVSPADSDDESDDIENSDEETIPNLASAINRSKPKKKNFPAKLVHPQGQQRKNTVKAAADAPPGGRRKWSLDEEEALINGYSKYQNQKEIWSKIKNDKEFSEMLKYRDNVALKDKWRNLSRK